MRLATFMYGQMSLKGFQRLAKGSQGSQLYHTGESMVLEISGSQLFRGMLGSSTHSNIAFFVLRVVRRARQYRPPHFLDGYRERVLMNICILMTACFRGVVDPGNSEIHLSAMEHFTPLLVIRAATYLPP